MKNHGFLLFSNRHDVPKTVAAEDLEEWDSIFPDSAANQSRSSKKKGDAVGKAKAEYELLVRARALLAQDYRALVKVLRILV